MYGSFPRGVRGTFSLGLILVCVLLGQIHAQTVTGSLSGFVLDSSGATVPNADVTLTSQETTSTIKAKTTEQGGFQFRSLQPGMYTLQVTATGFRKSELQALRVSIGRDLRVDVTLQLGELTDAVSVTTAGTAALENNAQISANFNTKLVAELPVSRANAGLDSVLLLTPGVVGNFSGGSGNSNGTRISANGAGGRSNNFNVDGQDVNEITTTGPAVFTNHADTVEEYQIVTRNYSAEFGQATGAVVNVVTKSGSNDLHGTAAYFYRNQKLFDTMTNLERRAGLTEAPAESTQTFGGTLGGPIRKNSLFFFGSYYGVRQPSSQLVQSGVSGLTPTPQGLQDLAAIASPAVRALIDRAAPFNIPVGNPTIQPNVATRLVPITVNGVTRNVEFGGIQRFISRPFSENQASIRLDYTGREKWKTFGRYFQQERMTRNSGGSATNGFVADLGFDGKTAGQTLIINPTATTVNETRVHFTRLARKLGGAQMPSFDNLDQAVTSIGLPAGYLTWGPGTNQPDGRVNDTYQFVNTFSWQKSNHFVRVGADLRRRVNDLYFLPTVNGRFEFANLNGFASNTPSQASVTYGNAGYNILDFQQYYFIQDDWRISPNLTVNLGLRYELFGQPINRLHTATLERESNAATSLYNPALPVDARIVPKVKSDRNNFAPRVGLVWSPSSFLTSIFGVNKSAIRLGYGMSYDIPFYNILLNMQSSSPVALSTSISAQPGLGLPMDPTGPAVRAALQGYAPIGQLDPRQLNQTIVSPDFYAPVSHQFNLSVQRELSASLSMEVAYVGTVSNGLLRSENGNPKIDLIARDFPGLLPANAIPAANGRLYNDYGFVRLRNNDGRSNYHALQSRVNYRGKSVLAGATYTLGRQRDTFVDVFGGAGGSSVSQNPFNAIQGEYSRGYLDFRHVGTGYFNVELPAITANAVAGKFLNGWQIGGTVLAQSGQPYTASQNNLGSIYADRNYNTSAVGPGGFDGSLRPFQGNVNAPATAIALDDVTARTRFPALVTGASPTGYYDFVALRAGQVQTISASDARFIVNTTETAQRFGTPFGNEKRNSLLGGKTLQANASVFKNVTVHEKLTLQVRAEAFNVLNHPNFGTPNAVLDNAGAAFASLGELNGGRRQIQFGLKLLF